MRMRSSVCSHCVPNSPYTVPIKGGPTDSINHSQWVQEALTVFYTFPTLCYTALYYTHIGPAAGFVCVCAYAMCICV